MFLNFIFNGDSYEYRESEIGQDGLYFLQDKTFVLVENITSDLQSEIDKKKASYDVDNYADLRADNYPSLAQQLDNLYHDIQSGNLNDNGSFFTANKAIKDMYPKSSEV